MHARVVRDYVAAHAGAVDLVVIAQHHDCQARGKAACVAKQVTRPVRNREARVTEPQLA
jgi:hypothetical protein